MPFLLNVIVLFILSPLFSNLFQNVREVLPKDCLANKGRTEVVSVCIIDLLPKLTLVMRLLASSLADIMLLLVFLPSRAY